MAIESLGNMFGSVDCSIVIDKRNTPISETLMTEMMAFVYDVLSR